MIIRCTNKVYLCELFEKAAFWLCLASLLFRLEYTFAEIMNASGRPSSSRFPTARSRWACTRSRTKRSCTALADVRYSAARCWPRVHPHGVDWRIGLLDGEPLFACKYYMAKDTGRFTTTPTTTRRRNL